MTDPHLLQIRGLHVTFGRGRRAVHAVRGVDVNIRPAEAMGIVGESGSGKSTTARIALGLLSPTNGGVAWRGDEITSRRSRRRHVRSGVVAAVMQDPRGSLDPQLPVRDLVTEHLWVRRRVSRAERTSRALELIESVALSGSIIDAHAGELSGGQQQRVAVARALCGDPDLLVLDEPVSALDVSTQAGLLRLLARLRAERHLAMLFISHDLGVVASLCDRVAVMRDGQIIEHGSVDDVLGNPTHDYTRELLAAVPVLHHSTS